MNRVVVTGVGVVSCLGLGLDPYLDALAAGRSGIRTIAGFDASNFPTRIAAEVPDFGEPLRDYIARTDLSPADAAVLFTDRKVAFACLAADQALRSAFGPAELPYAPHERALSMGVGLEIIVLEDLVRAAGTDGRVVAATLKEQLAGRHPAASFRIAADIGPRTAARLHGLKGPHVVNVSACVAGTQSIGQGFRMIRRGFKGFVLAGGTDSMVNPLAVAGFGLLSATTTSNQLGPKASRPFDRKRDGFVLGEGACLLVLEEREAARARTAVILAEIVGYGSSFDAFKITDPDEEGLGARASMQAALDDAGLTPADIDYINAHGTSTKKNDAVESLAIHSVFKERARTLPVSSTKSAIGHSISAAGALEFAASLLCFRRNLIPPTLNYEEPDPQCPLDVVPGAAREAHVRTFLSNSFGFGGQNGSIIARRHA
jgi:3-oxoacyl-[acyl-carrier-protein] synthase II